MIKNVKIVIIEAFKSKFYQYFVFTKEILHRFFSFCISLIFTYCLFVEKKLVTIKHFLLNFFGGSKYWENTKRHFKISFTRENEAIKHDLVEFKVQCLKVFCYHGNKCTILLFYSIFRTTAEVSSKLYFVEICQVSENLWLFNHKRANFWLPNFGFKRSLLSLLNRLNLLPNTDSKDTDKPIIFSWDCNALLAEFKRYFNLRPSLAQQASRWSLCFHWNCTEIVKGGSLRLE